MDDDDGVEDEPLEPLDLPAPALDDDDDGRELEAGVTLYGARRLIGKVLGAVVALLVGTCAGDTAAEWRLDRADDLVDDCGRDHEPARTCRVPWVLWPRIWPRTHRDAVELRTEARYTIAARTLTRATRVDFDAELAAATLPEVLDSEALSLHDLQRWGAHEQVVALARAGRLDDGHVSALTSAILLGEPDVAIEVGVSGGLDDGIWALEGAAWGCLGEGERGVWKRAPAGHEDTRDLAVLALLACRGPDVGVDVLDDWFVRIGTPQARAWFMAREADHGRLSASERLDLHADDRDNPDRASVVAVAVRDEHPSAERLVVWLDGLEVSERVELAGRGLFVARPDATAITYGPEIMADAAVELARLSTQAQPNVDPAVLLHGAAVLADEAALELLARGRADAALALARRARPWHTPEDEHLAVGLALLAGDHEGALAWVAARRGPPGPNLRAETRQRLAELELRALAGLGRWQSAYWQAHALRHDADALPGHRLLVHSWAAALSIQLGHAHAWTPADPHTSGRDAWSGRDLANIVKLWNNPDLARSARARDLYLELPAGYGELAVRMIGALAHDPAHEAAWLDAALGYDRALGRGLLLARAEAARWRGDVEAEQRWRARLDRLLALANSEDRALLLHAAGF